MEKLAPQSPDLTQRNVEAIATIFPTVVCESRDEKGNVKHAIDFDLLRQELSDHIVEGPQERYQLDWPGKRAALLAANAPIAKTLRPMREESVDFDTTRNLLIEGDNLDALKLLQESYLGKIRLIYIDPPYNTGNDFIYADDFAESTDDYLARSGQVDAEGTRLVANSESNGRFHSRWLTMLYPRLKLAHRLLADDGVICVSIDDHEVDNLRKALGEIFGWSNFIAMLPRVTKKAGKSGELISFNHDYIVMFGRSSAVVLNRQFHSDSGFRNEDEFVETRGRYKLNQTLDYSSIQYSASLDYEIELDGRLLRPGGASRDDMVARQKRNPRTDWCWRWSRGLFKFGLANGFVVLKDGRDGPRIYTKTYENATIRPQGGSYAVVTQQRTKAITSLDLTDNRFSNDMASKNVRSLFDFAAFDYTKPVELVARLIGMVTVPGRGDVVLDFFAGSGTTGQAVFDANAADGGDRRFVLVQLGEAIDASSESGRRGFTTISQLTKERLRRAALKHKSADHLVASDLDLGFRALTVDTTNFVDVLRAPDAIGQDELDGLVDNVRPGRSNLDLLVEVLLGWGLDPSLPVKTDFVADHEVLIVDDGALIACFSSWVPPAVIEGIATREPLRAVFRDSAFASDAERINAEQIFAQPSSGTELKSI